MFICYSLRLFKYLVANDLIPEGQRNDLKNYNRKVWEFKDTNRLRELLEVYKCLKEDTN